MYGPWPPLAAPWPPLAVLPDRASTATWPHRAGRSRLHLQPAGALAPGRSLRLESFCFTFFTPSVTPRVTLEGGSVNDLCLLRPTLPP